MLSAFRFYKFYSPELRSLNAIVRFVVISIAYLLTSFDLVKASICYIFSIILSLCSSMLAFIALKSSWSEISVVIILSQILRFVVMAA